ncbi:MAG TPA: tetratricopeptide repeat protein, partial [Bryobacteraceae bacterium]|nr:tetratricopeptide repeat protein [Bryobacteraceae bacterium]
MRALCCVFFALILSAQVPAPVPQPQQPQWLMDLVKIRQELHQAELGSLDAKVEQAWRAALATPQHPRFPEAAQMAWGCYQAQGYDLKAEQVLRQALAAVPTDDPRIRRNLRSNLAIHFESTQQLVKALSIREEMAKEPPPATDGYSHETAALANLYERMGEIEKAEAAWKEAAASRAAGSPQNDSRFARTARRAFSPFGYVRGSQNELAGFYARRGRTAEAEQLYQKALDDAAQNNSAYEWSRAADNYIGFLSQERRFSEAIDLVRQSIARLEASADPQDARMLLSKRQHLASLLTQAGRSDEALEMQKQTVELAQAQNPSGLEYVQALGSLAETLVSQNRLEEAEKSVARMREAGAADTRNGK